jgi:hypothetical protein
MKSNYVNDVQRVFIKNRNGQFDDFHQSTKADAEEEIRISLGEIEIRSNICVPPVFSTLKMII